MNLSTAEVASFSARGYLQNVVELESIIERAEPTEQASDSVRYQRSREWTVEIFYGGEFKISSAQTQSALDDAIHFLTETLDCDIGEFELLRMSVRGNIENVPPNKSLERIAEPIKASQKTSEVLVGDEAVQYGGDVYARLDKWTLRLFVQREIYFVSGVRVSDTSNVAQKVQEVRDVLTELLSN